MLRFDSDGAPPEPIEGVVRSSGNGKGVFVVPAGAEWGPVWPKHLWFHNGYESPEAGGPFRGMYQPNDKGGIIIRVDFYRPPSSTEAPPPVESEWAAMLRGEAPGESEDIEEGAANIMGPAEVCNGYVPERPIADLYRDAVVLCDKSGKMQPALVPCALREVYGRSHPDTLNYGFGVFNAIASCVPRPFDIKKLTRNYSKKGRYEYAFPSSPRMNRYEALVDPCCAQDGSGTRTPMFAFCDVASKGWSPGMETVVVRLPMACAMMPGMTSGAYPTGRGDAGEPPLFNRYMMDGAREQMHHNCRGWLVARDREDDQGRVAVWLQGRLPAVLDMLVDGLCQMCDADVLPYDTHLAVLVNLPEERLDTYVWSPAHKRQYSICFERWFGGNDGWGKAVRPQSSPDWYR